MKIWILIALCASTLLLGCLNNNQINTNQTNQINTTTYPNIEPNPTASTQAAANVYLKDAPIAATSVQVEIKKVTLINNYGEAEVIFQGSQTATLDEKTTSRIASQQINAQQYTQIQLELGEEATVTDQNGAHTALVSNTQVTSSLNTEVNNNQTIQIVIDIPLNATVQATTQGDYTFNPPQETTAATTIQAGVQITSIGVISVDVENTLGIDHTPLNTNINTNLNVSTVLG